jgi:hypothetical protein
MRDRRDRRCRQVEAAEDAYRRPTCMAEELGIYPLVAPTPRFRQALPARPALEIDILP